MWLNYFPRLSYQEIMAMVDFDRLLVIGHWSLVIGKH